MAKEPLIPNIAGPREDRGFWLDLSIALAVIIAWVMAYFGYQELLNARQQRTLQHVERELERLGSAMDMEYGRISGDLVQFGSWLSRMELESTPVPVLIRPFIPFLTNNPGVSAVRIANEHGDHLTITDLDTVLLIAQHHWLDTVSVRWSRDAHWPFVIDTIDFDTMALRDVRSLPWFGAALQDRRAGPTWGAVHPLPGASALGLTASLALRSDTSDQALSVLAFDVRLFDPERIVAPDPHQRAARFFVLAADGAQLMPVRDMPMLRALQVERSALSHPNDLWTSVDGEQVLASVRPYLLNGTELQIGAIVPLAGFPLLDGLGHYMLIGAALLLLVITVLLLLAYRRRRREFEAHRMQAERNRSQRQRLAKAIGEREVLNREVHHRVKNNLQVVTSLLNLQLRKLEEGSAKDEFHRGVRRIDNMAVVHHKLYGLQDLRGIDLNQFFGGLVDHIAATTDTKGTTVSCAIETAGIKADADTAIELGVILCELVGNCYQHAFPFATGGHIEVSVSHVEGDLHRLVVKDNGKGFDNTIPEGTGKLGLEVVEALAYQLDGNFKMSSAAGTTFDVLFRMAKPVQH